MSAWKYKQLMPRVIVEKLRLLNAKDMVDLCGRSLENILPALAKTPYHPEIMNIPSEHLDYLSLENALLNNFIKTCKEIADYSPRKIRFLLSAILTKFEANNIKTMLRAINADINIDAATDFIIPVGNIDRAHCRKKLENSKNLSDLIENLLDTEYGAVLKKALNGTNETNVIQTLETTLDRHVYEKIWKAVGKLKGLDKKISKAVLGIEIDSINVKIILRCKAMGVSEGLTRRYLIPLTEVLTEKDFEIAIKTSDIGSSIESLLAAARFALARDHEYMLTAILKEYESSKSLPQLEAVLERSLLKTSLKMLKRYTPFFNIGLILAFLNLKWFEVKNLRAVVQGAEDKIPPQKIRKMLILAD